MPQQTLSIIGLGLIGGSVGLATKKHLNSVQVIGYDQNIESARLAAQRLAIDRSADSLEQAIALGDRILICVPPSAASAVLTTIAQHARPETAVSDVLSTKRAIVAAAEKVLPPTISFVGSHPIAGSEKTGILHADDRLLAGALCAISCARPVSNRSSAGWIDFWQKLGLRTIEMSPDEHDRRFAAVSHLPHALAAALMNATDAESINFAGKGFADTTRIAAGNPELWRDILLENRDPVLSGLNSITAELRKLAALLDAGDGDGLLNYLRSAAERRRTLPPQRPGA